MGLSRLEFVNSLIQKKGEAKLSELEAMMPDVSSMTLRRDLAILEDRGDIIRIRGGARSIASLSERFLKEEAYYRRAVEHNDAKTLIASKAVHLIEHARSLFVDSGTTTMSFVKALPEQSFSILTSAPNIGLELIKKPNTTVTLIGGQLNKDNLSVSGTNSLNFIKNLNIDIAFMATSGFSLESGFTSGNVNECELKKYVVKKSSKVIMLMDNSKLNQNMLFSFAFLKDIDVLVTDQQLPENIIKAAAKMKVKII